MKLPIVERLFVLLIFAVLYASFLVLPWQLSQEFAATDWLSIGVFHSYLFIFYPLFGLVVLVAFYLPAVIFTNLYWHHIEPFGRLRFIFGFFVVVALALVISANLLNGQPRAVWEIAPNIPDTAADVSATCKPSGAGCRAGPLLSPMFAVRAASRQRVGLEKFARTCKPDNLLETPPHNAALRQCFVTGQKSDAKACCVKQEEFAANVTAHYVTPGVGADQIRIGVLSEAAINWYEAVVFGFNGRISKTGYWHAVTLPLKTFFIIIIIVVAAFLVIWHDKVVEHYGPCKSKMERGLIVSAVAMLFWPLMEYAYAQSAGVMFGNWEPGVNIKASIVILPWAVLIGVYFMRSRGLGLLPQLGSVVGALFAMLQYDQLTNLAVRFTGSGAGWTNVVILAALALAGLCIVLWPSNAMRENVASQDLPKTPRALPAAAGSEAVPAKGAAATEGTFR